MIEWAGGDPLKDLEAYQKEILKKVGIDSFPLAIWFVEEDNAYEILASKLKIVDKPIPANPFLFNAFWGAGVPVYRWSTEQDGEDKVPNVAFLNPPCRGVWIQMSNGEDWHYIFCRGKMLCVSGGTR